jgi:hypothetical protein
VTHRKRFFRATKLHSPDKASADINQASGSRGNPGPCGRGWPPGGAEVRCVVLIAKVEVIELTPFGVSVDGEAVQVAAAGRPLQASVTWALYPNSGFTVTVRLVEFPATIVTVNGATAKPKSEPEPPKETTCGLVGALSVMVKVPVSVPATVGANETLIVQAAPAARLCGQVFVWEKSPVITMLVMVKAAVPLFVRLSV